jgi:dipeptidyl aminopeptidase/acylaminoacyl peptidase
MSSLLQGLRAAAFTSAMMAKSAMTPGDAAAVTATGDLCAPAATAATRATGPSLAVVFTMRRITGVALSPDGAWVAYVVRQADTVANDYRTALCVARADGRVPPRTLGTAGPAPQTLYMGVLGDMSPSWSPDSRFIGYVMPEGRGHRRGLRQLFRWSRDGGAPLQLTRSKAEVLYGVWAPDGRHVLYAALAPRPDSAALATRYRDKGVWYFDLGPVRNWSVAMQRPTKHVTQHDTRNWGSVGPATYADGLLDNAVNRMTEWVEPGSGRSDLSGPYVIRSLELSVPLDPTGGDRSATEAEDSIYHEIVAARDGDWRRLDGQTKFTRVHVTGTSAHQFANGGRDTIAAFTPREMVGRVALLALVPGQEPRRVPPDTDSYSQCSFARAVQRFACVRESPTRPPEIAVVNADGSGARRLSHLNPELDAIAFPGAELVAWRDSLGNECFGMYWRPTGYVAGRRYPTLVLPFYSTDWDFPWAVAQEYPIHVFTAHGIAVFTPDIMRYVAGTGEGPDAMARMRVMDLQSVFAGLDLLVQRDMADPDRIGVAGLSYGAMFVDWAIGHSSRFRAAAATSAGTGPLWYYAYSEEVRERARRDFGGSPEGGGRATFRENSAPLRADRVSTPLLIDVTEHEYPTSLQMAIELREHGKPVEMVIFPDGGHFKRWVRQIASTWALNLDWFRFWLQGEEDPDGSKAEQYRRWRALSQSAGTKQPIDASSVRTLGGTRAAEDDDHE